ncbi:MAG TPA: efflux RND transporter permease subunit [Candidatus Saccharimonadales bacterium]
MLRFRQRRANKTRIPLISRITLFFYDRPRSSLLIWLLIFAFGIASYTTLLKREGFPEIHIPYTYVNGPYLVDDPQKVDRDVTKPLSEVISRQPRVKTVQAFASANSFNVVVQYEEGTQEQKATADLEKAVKDAEVLPEDAKPEFRPLSPSVNERGDDILIVFFDKDNQTSTEELTRKAEEAAKYLANQAKIPLATYVKIVDPYVRGTDPRTGQPAISQSKFDFYGVRQNDQTKFYRSVSIGIKGQKGFDVLDLDKQVLASIDKLNSAPEFSGFKAARTFSSAPSITDQISGLQGSLLEGLMAILVVSAILIALRASIITVSAMALVVITTLGVLYVIGYSINTITLFSLVLGLSLIVDDTIIMVEAIDAARRRLKSAREAIAQASRKISRAMLAATATAIFGFAPLIFVGGILGEFIRAIPITVMTSLVVSLIVAITFIPFLSRLILLRPKMLGSDDKSESIAHHIEVLVAKTLSRPLLWMRGRRKRQFTLGISAVVVGLVFIAGGAALFQKVTFNIFAPSKDSDLITITFTYPPNQSIEQIETTADRADETVAKTLGPNFKNAAYYATGNAHQAQLFINLKSFKQRGPDVTAPKLTKQLDKAFSDFPGALVQTSSSDVGPPAGAFSVRIETTNLDVAYKLADDLKNYLAELELKRPDGSLAHLKNINIGGSDTLTRYNTKSYVSVASEFDDTDTSTLVILAQNAVKKDFPPQKVANYGLPRDAIAFDIGFESENQNSFKTLLIALPILLLAIYLLLITQFRSLLQPALIFMAIPFSLFGITTGLWLTDNAFSFFTMLGFFALIGLSIKNTILLTDYANQARRQGHGPVDSMAIALQERFRPLIATSFTAVFSLIPLYLSNPFWEGLAVTLMCGLLSSTFLVVVVFPYYYLGAEFVRLYIRRKTFLLWLITNVALIGASVVASLPQLVPVIMLATTIGWPLVLRIRSPKEA